MAIYRAEMKEEYVLTDIVELYMEDGELVMRTGEDRLFPEIVLTEDESGTISSITLKGKGQKYKCNIGNPKTHGARVKFMGKNNQTLSTRSLVIPKDKSEYVAIMSIYSKIDKKKDPFSPNKASDAHLDIYKAFIADQIDVVEKVLNGELDPEYLKKSAEEFNAKSEKEKFENIDKILEVK